MMILMVNFEGKQISVNKFPEKYIYKKIEGGLEEIEDSSKNEGSYTDEEAFYFIRRKGASIGGPKI